MKRCAATARSEEDGARVSRSIIRRIFLVSILACGCRAELGALKINEAADLYKKGEYAEALVAYDDSIRLNSTFGWAHLGRGNCLEALGRSAESVDAYREAARLMPDEAEAHYWLGVSLYKDGRPDDARVSLQEAIRLRPDDSRAYVSLGMALSVLGEHDEAIESFGRGRALCGRQCGLWAEAEERHRQSFSAQQAGAKPTPTTRPRGQ